MLILTRRIGECVMIGESVVVKVCAVNGHQVRLGIEAPKAVKILREELRDRSSMRAELELEKHG